MLSFFPRDVSDEIWDLIESVSEGISTYFCVPFDFELLEMHMQFYQAGLSDRLKIELTINDYD